MRSPEMRFVEGFCLVCLMVATAMSVPTSVTASEGAGGPERVAGDMAAAARQLVASLDEAGRERVLFPFEEERRRKWTYLPGGRAGLPLGEMTPGQRRLVHRLLRSALDTPGYLKVHGVMQLEEVLGEIEGSGAVRDPEAYYLALYGDPGPEQPWSWRFEGHHLSVHFTAVPGQGVSSTPLFLGANPAEVPRGTWVGLRLLAPEEDLARALVNSLDRSQRARAVVAERAPSDILTRRDPAARPLEPEGLPAAEMTAAQRDLLWRLIEEYVGNVAPELAAVELERIRSGGLDHLTFAWAGGTEPGEGHYYRIQGESLLVEYDNTQGSANHVHSVWRDLERDFGGDLLRQHYATSPHHHGPDAPEEESNGEVAPDERGQGKGETP